MRHDASHALAEELVCSDCQDEWFTAVGRVIDAARELAAQRGDATKGDRIPLERALAAYDKANKPANTRKGVTE
jgi:hypothetical protein